MTEKKSVDEIYTSLFNRIMKKTFPPDSWLKEDQLAEEYNVSRTPVREVLRSLEQDGLVQIISNRGARVLAFTADDLDLIFEIRRVLEVLALEYAAPSLSIQTLGEIRNAIAASRDREDYAVHAALDARLHQYLIESSGQRRLINMLKQLFHILQTFREIGFEEQEVRTTTYAEHLELLDALIVRDSVAAKELLARHIKNSKHRILKSVLQGGG